MRRIIIFIVAAIALLGVDSAMAQSKTSYFMEGSIYRNDLNPALAPTRGYISLPGLSGMGLNATSNFVSVDNFLYQKNGEVVTALHGSVSADEFFGKLPSLGKMTFDAKANILGLGFYAKKMFWTFGINTTMSADMAMSMDMFKALKTLGNGLYDLGDTAIDANAYLDVYLGTSFRILNFINIGVKAKFLVGIINLEGQFSQLSANVTPDSISASLRGQLRANGLFLDKSSLQGGEELAISEILNFSPNYMLGNIKNFGGAIDLGAEVRLFGDHLRLSAAVTDLGFIKWRDAGHVAGTAEGDFEFKGINLSKQEVDATGSFGMRLTEASQNVGYTSRLNCSLNVGVEYNILNNHIAFGVLSHTKFCRTMTLSELTASVNFRPTNWLSATVSHTFLNGNRPGVLGFALNIHPAGINILLGADYIDTRYVKAGIIPLERYASSLNLYTGVSFNFGRPKFIRENDSVKRSKKSEKES